MRTAKVYRVLRAMYRCEGYIVIHRDENRIKAFESKCKWKNGYELDPHRKEIPPKQYKENLELHKLQVS